MSSYVVKADNIREVIKRMKALATGAKLFVWFLQTVESRNVESFLIRSLKPPWNAALIG